MIRRIGGSIAAVGMAALMLGGASALGADSNAGFETIELHLATIDGQPDGNGHLPALQAYVDALREVSGGRIQVDLTPHYGDGAADAEENLLRAIASGDLDGGWPSTRAFANAGFRGLEAVEAPMTITNYDAERELVSGPVADTLLAQLDGTPVMGLDLAVGPLRRPFAVDAPLLSPDDWQGVPFRAFDSPVQSAAITALGGTPVQAGADWAELARSGGLKGAEFDIAQYDHNGLTSEAPYVTADVVLWPKVFVLSMNRARYDSLTEEQRGWIAQAAEMASAASVDASYDETALVGSLCAQGVQFLSSSPEQVAALRTTLAPVIESLAADPVTAPTLKDIQAIAAAHPETDVPEIPAGCGDGVVGADGSAPVPDTTSQLPAGTYRVLVTLADLAAANVGNGPGYTGTWTLTVGGDGTYAISCRFQDDPANDCGHSGADGVTVEAGQLHGVGDRVWFVSDPERLSQINGCTLPVSNAPGHCADNDTYSLRWALTGDELSLAPADAHPWANMVVVPWQKID